MDSKAQEQKPIHAKPSVYAYYFESLKSIAKDYGYNLVVHGSMNRDLDLIAVPWVNEPKPEMDMINALSEYINGFKSDDKGIFLHGVLPGGRNAYVLNVNRGGYMNTGTGLHEDPKFLSDPQYYIDISVTVNPALQSENLRLRKLIHDSNGDCQRLLSEQLSGVLPEIERLKSDNDKLAKALQEVVNKYGYSLNPSDEEHYLSLISTHNKSVTP